MFPRWRCDVKSPRSTASTNPVCLQATQWSHDPGYRETRSHLTEKRWNTSPTQINLKTCIWEKSDLPSSGCQMIPPKKRKPLPHFHACVHLKCSSWSIITQITLDRWAGDFNKKLKEIFHFDFDLPAVFIDTFHRRTNQHEVSVFILQSKIQCNAFTCELFIVCAF